MKRSYTEIRENNKKRMAELAEQRPDPRAKERFEAPAYQAGSPHGKCNRTLRELIDYLLDGLISGRLEGRNPVPEDVVEYIHGGHVDVSEYLARKYRIKRGEDTDGQGREDRK